MFAVVVEGERLRHALALVVAAALADGVDVAPVPENENKTRHNMKFEAVTMQFKIRGR